MHIDTSTIKRGDKTYTRHLLRTSYREDGKVRHKTLLNLSDCSDGEIRALKLALKHKGNLASLASLVDVETQLRKRIGAVWALKVIAERLGITKALGGDLNGKLALLQVMARVIDQGSRLSAVRLAESHALCEVIGIDQLNEYHLYDNLEWLAEQQADIEKKLYDLRFQKSPPTLFLYDVTSSYLEGECNALGQYGYNRDRKKGKLQIVVGMLTGPDGLPVAVRVFEGNTNDTKTVSDQIRILAENFGVKEVTLVGDRGMLKGPQIEELPEDFRYITAITKPQTAKLLSEGTLQLELFRDDVCEVDVGDIRYVLRRNPMRAKEIAESRDSKFAAINKYAAEQSKHLADHPKADAAKALDRVKNRILRLKADQWISASLDDKRIDALKDDAALLNAALLDGCYVIKSDVPKNQADAQTLHDRYCDLENVERAFRTMKTTHLDLRPIYVKKESSTRGHVFVVMLALLMQRELETCWASLNTTVVEGLDELGAIHELEVILGGVTVIEIPKPNKLGAALLDNAKIQLPSVLPSIKASVHTNKKLQSERIQK